MFRRLDPRRQQTVPVSGGSDAWHQLVRTNKSSSQAVVDPTFASTRVFAIKCLIGVTAALIGFNLLCNLVEPCSLVFPVFNRSICEAYPPNSMGNWVSLPLPSTSNTGCSTTCGPGRPASTMPLIGCGTRPPLPGAMGGRGRYARNKGHEGSMAHEESMAPRAEKAHGKIFDWKALRDW